MIHMCVYVIIVLEFFGDNVLGCTHKNNPWPLGIETWDQLCKLVSDTQAWAQDSVFGLVLGNVQVLDPGPDKLITHCNPQWWRIGLWGSQRMTWTEIFKELGEHADKNWDSEFPIVFFFLYHLVHTWSEFAKIISAVSSLNSRVKFNVIFCDSLCVLGFQYSR